ncbi:uncharacterized protein LOC129745624 [Uranotaenia lowii]|uniref:uncharacterized protein LOC129741449 n=1 Tax=Uranotaenia lowii TaxID=190385 RepID=UPI0024798A02|nr:uncharacterized protein LOC129741449 [Uranotaenia lowii]XP_055594795.1 uncharacterized protein LOC129745624 [Uranotaenia lowii]
MFQPSGFARFREFIPKKLAAKHKLQTNQIHTQEMATKKNCPAGGKMHSSNQMRPDGQPRWQCLRFLRPAPLAFHNFSRILHLGKRILSMEPQSDLYHHRISSTRNELKGKKRKRVKSKPVFMASNSRFLRALELMDRDRNHHPKLFGCRSNRAEKPPELLLASCNLQQAPDSSSPAVRTSHYMN